MAAPPAVVIARLPFVMSTVYGPSTFQVPAEPLAMPVATVVPFRARENVALLLSSQVYRLTLYVPDGIAVIVTRAPGDPEPHTEHRIIVAVSASVAGFSVTFWLQNRLGPEVRFGCGRTCLERHAVDGDRSAVEVHRPVHGGGIDGRGCRTRREERNEEGDHGRPDGGAQKPAPAGEHVFRWHPSPKRSCDLTKTLNGLGATSNAATRLYGSHLLPTKTHNGG